MGFGLQRLWGVASGLKPVNGRDAVLRSKLQGLRALEAPNLSKGTRLMEDWNSRRGGACGASGSTLGC